MFTSGTTAVCARTARCAAIKSAMPFRPNDSISRSCSCEKVASSPAALHFDELAILRRDQIEIDRDRFVFLVIQIEQRHAVKHTGADRRDQFPDRRLADFSFAHQSPASHRDSQAGSSDRGRARPAVGLQHIAIDPHRARTQVSPDRPPRAASARSTAGSRCSGRRAGLSRCRAACGSLSSRAASNIPPSASRR